MLSFLYSYNRGIMGIRSKFESKIEKKKFKKSLQVNVLRWRSGAHSSELIKNKEGLKKQIKPGTLQQVIAPRVIRRLQEILKLEIIEGIIYIDLELLFYAINTLNEVKGDVVTQRIVTKGPAGVFGYILEKEQIKKLGRRVKNSFLLFSSIVMGTSGAISTPKFIRIPSFFLAIVIVCQIELKGYNYNPILRDIPVPEGSSIPCVMIPKTGGKILLVTDTDMSTENIPDHEFYNETDAEFIKEKGKNGKLITRHRLKTEKKSPQVMTLTRLKQKDNDGEPILAVDAEEANKNIIDIRNNFNQKNPIRERISEQTPKSNEK